MFKSKSTFLILIFNLRFQDLFCPWKIIIDLDNNLITTEKRNWYLIGIDRTTVPINYVRNITIDEHLFGADIYIKIYGSNISAFYIPKKDAIKIKEILT